MTGYFPIKGKPRKKARDLETPVHVEILTFIKANCKEGLIVFHVPNEARRSPQLCAKQKRMGLTAGIPDLCLIYNSRAYFIEVKADMKSRLSDSQKIMIPLLQNQGCPTIIAWDTASVKAFMITNRLWKEQDNEN